MDTTTNDTVQEGWAIPLRANKPHYFRKGMSLCRKWMFLGTIYADEQSTSQMENDCKSCWNKLNKEVKHD